MPSQSLIHQLQLKPHPEGGYYKETYRSAETVVADGNRKRNVCTAIYYLLDASTPLSTGKSNFHRLKSDELWFFHSGMALEILTIEGGRLVTVTIGPSTGSGTVPPSAGSGQASTGPEADQRLMVVIPAHTWFAARVKDSKGYGLVSCIVAPGFDFADFELADRQDLLNQHPHLREVIEEFTR